MIGLYIQHFYEYDGSFAQIGVFVVDEKYRGKGIGKKLLITAEKWAEEQGALKVLINSGNRDERKESHSFYNKMGYKAKSIGFLKDIRN